MASQDLKHSTLVFERICAAPVERVFAAFADPEERASWERRRKLRLSCTTRSTSGKAASTSFDAATGAILNIAGSRPITTLSLTSASFRVRSWKRRDESFSSRCRPSPSNPKAPEQGSPIPYNSRPWQVRACSTARSSATTRPSITSSWRCNDWKTTNLTRRQAAYSRTREVSCRWADLANGG